MAIMPQIAMGFQPPQLQAPQTGNTLALIAQLEGARQSNALREAQMRKLQLDEERQNALTQIAASGKMPTLAQAAGAGKPGLDLYQAMQKQEEDKTKKMAERQQTFAESLYSIENDPSIDNLAEVVRTIRQRGMLEGLEGTAAEMLMMTPDERRTAVKRIVQTTPGMGPYIDAARKRLLENEKLRTESAKTIRETQLLGQEQPTADIKNYDQAVRQGFQGSFFDYQSELAKAKRSPGAQIFMAPAEKAEEIERAKGLVQEEKEVADFAQAARRAKTTVESAQRVLDRGFKTGFGADAKAAAARVLAELGVKEASTFATDAQTFLKAAKENVLARQLEQKGVQTNQDADRIEQTFAQLGNTPEANQFIIDMTLAQANRAIEQDKFYRDWLRNNKSMKGARAAWFDQEGDKSIFERPELQKYVQPAESVPLPGVIDFNKLRPR